jgi:hypothetical protein
VLRLAGLMLPHANLSKQHQQQQQMAPARGLRMHTLWPLENLGLSPRLALHV